MVEPTESESQQELDLFIAAMIAIRREIAAVESGALDKHDNPLNNAPLPADVLVADEWPHPYRAQDAAYPVATLRGHKYSPPVRASTISRRPASDVDSPPVANS